jgi:outer membrane protein TolC
MQSQYGLTQKFIRHEKRMTDGSIASREYEAALAEVTATEREVIQQIKFSCVELGLQRQTRAILEKSRTLIDQIIEVAEARLRAGGSQQDIIRAEIERARLDQRIIELDRRISTSLISLAAAVQLPSESLAECPYEFPIADLELAFESILASATINNPDLQRLQSNVERDTCKQYRAGLERQPDVTLGIQYGFMTANNSISPVADGRDMIGMVMGMNLPVRTARIQAGVNEACQQRIQSMHALEDEQLRLNRDLESLIEEVRSLDAQHDLLDARIQPATEQSYRVAIADYTASKLDFAQLVEAFNDLLEIEVERATLRAELARALIRMETLGGIVPSDAAPVSDPQ